MVYAILINSPDACEERPEPIETCDLILKKSIKSIYKWIVKINIPEKARMFSGKTRDVVRSHVHRPSFNGTTIDLTNRDLLCRARRSNDRPALMILPDQPYVDCE